MPSLTTSGDPINSFAPVLHNRLYNLEQLKDERWEPLGDLALLPNTAFLNHEKLYHVHFHQPTNSVGYSYAKGTAHRTQTRTAQQFMNGRERLVWKAWPKTPHVPPSSPPSINRA